jgi:hypothetical protein
VPLMEQPAGENGAPEDRPSEDRAEGADDLFAAASAAPKRKTEPAPMIGRNVLLELRDSLRAFLTLLENE